jgi:hypothetical protein
VSRNTLQRNSVGGIIDAEYKVLPPMSKSISGAILEQNRHEQFFLALSQNPPQQKRPF